MPSYPDHAGDLIAILGSAPADLLEYYQREQFPEYPQSSIHGLSFEKARDYSRALNRIPAMAPLGLWALDDANDSNPYTYISKGPCAGMILHLSHDDSSEIAFGSLAKFVEAMHRAGGNALDIGEIEPQPEPRPLNDELWSLATKDNEDATFLIAIYLPIAADLQPDTKTVLASHGDFFVREAFATFLADNGSSEDLSLAEDLLADAMPQVARAGEAAVRTIRRKIAGARGR